VAAVWLVASAIKAKDYANFYAVCTASAPALSPHMMPLLTDLESTAHAENSIAVNPNKQLPE
jgi:hypothetical protein